MPMSLASFPPELFSCVVANIESQPTLCSLAQCSRKLYLCTIPHIYRHVTVEEEFRQRKQLKGQLKNVASVLIRRPDLAGLVRHFTLHVARPHRSNNGYSLCEELEESHDQDFAAVTNALSLSDEEKIKCLGQVSHNHKSYHDLILALLLPALLKVERLELNLKIGYDTYYLEKMIQRVARRERPFDTQPPFELLKVFVLSHDFFNARSPGFIASLLALPVIQEISAGFGNMWDDENRDPSEFRLADEIPTELDRGSSSLTSLNLAAYRLSTVNLAHILQAPKGLKRLFYKFCPPDHINCTDLRHALGPQENSLESLALDCDIAFHGMHGISKPMTSFISFNTLKLFQTTAVFLETTESGAEGNNLINIFPPSLETLHLTRFQPHFKSILEALEHLLAQKSPQQIPSLKTLILEEPYYADARFANEPAKLMDVLWRGTQENAMERLDRVAAAQDVSLDVTEESFWEVESPVVEWEMNDSSESSDEFSHCGDWDSDDSVE